MGEGWSCWAEPWREMVERERMAWERVREEEEAMALRFVFRFVVVENEIETYEGIVGEDKRKYEVCVVKLFW